MIKWGPNGRPVNGGRIPPHNPPKYNPTGNPKPKTKKLSYIEIINEDNLIDMNMQINIVGRLLDTKNHPIANANIEVIDNNKLVTILKTSTQGYFIFNGGYIGRYHTFLFSFKGNNKFKSYDKSLIIL